MTALTQFTDLWLQTSLCAPAAAMLPRAEPAGLASAVVHETDSLRQVYEAAFPWDVFFEQADARRDMWIQHWDNATPHPDLAARAEAVGGSWRILAIAVAGCSDSVSLLP
ncbi:MAG: hypothetical protein WD960_09535 [Gemmatimonadota bacterium]